MWPRIITAKRISGRHSGIVQKHRNEGSSQKLEYFPNPAGSVDEVNGSIRNFITRGLVIYERGLVQFSSGEVMKEKMKYEQPKLIGLSSDIGLVAGACGVGSGDAGDCQAGANAKGSTCASGASNRSACQSGASARTCFAGAGARATCFAGAGR